MCVGTESVLEGYGLFGVTQRGNRLSDRFSSYIEEIYELERRMAISDVRRETRMKRYLDLKNRLIPALVNQLQP